jgi:nucleoside-diphosphate-sugar epimerase
MSQSSAGISQVDPWIVAEDDVILITGAAGFIGSKLVEQLLNLGFRNLRCLARPSARLAKLEAVVSQHRQAKVDVFPGNLLSREDCMAASRGAAAVFHLAAGRGEKSHPDAFMNSVVTTRNLLDAVFRNQSVRRFVNVSSFAVYTNTDKPHGRLLDESCPTEKHPELRGDAYSYAKVKQDEIVQEYGRNFGIPYVIVRPGYVYGPGKHAITGRVGIGSFGIFLHLGGSNPIPFTYLDNCAEAIALTGLKPGLDGEVFNVVDDDLPSSRQFLRQYKKEVRRFPSIYVPHAVSYLLCDLWLRYSRWSAGQLPPRFNPKEWHAYWKKTRYSNERLKECTGWRPRVSTGEGLRRYFEGCRQGVLNA